MTDPHTRTKGHGRHAHVRAERPWSTTPTSRRDLGPATVAGTGSTPSRRPSAAPTAPAAARRPRRWPRRLRPASPASLPLVDRRAGRRPRCGPTCSRARPWRPGCCSGPVPGLHQVAGAAGRWADGRAARRRLRHPPAPHRGPRGRGRPGRLRPAGRGSWAADDVAAIVTELLERVGLPAAAGRARHRAGRPRRRGPHVPGPPRPSPRPTARGQWTEDEVAALLVRRAADPERARAGGGEIHRDRNRWGRAGRGVASSAA